jgi:hypothetical protein
VMSSLGVHNILELNAICSRVVEVPPSAIDPLAGGRVVSYPFVKGRVVSYAFGLRSSFMHSAGMLQPSKGVSWRGRMPGRHVLNRLAHRTQATQATRIQANYLLHLGTQSPSDPSD